MGKIGHVGIRTEEIAADLSKALPSVRDAEKAIDEFGKAMVRASQKIADAFSSPEWHELYRPFDRIKKRRSK